MAVQADQIYRDQEQIVDSLLAALVARISDIWTQEDGNVRLMVEVLAGEYEGNYLANELLRNDMFIQLANSQALDQHGEMFGLVRKAGTFAEGEVVFSGGGGTSIPTGTQVAANPGTDDSIYYNTDTDATIPNPGLPAAPTTADNGVGLITAGTLEYAIAFVTTGGQTTPGTISIPLVLANLRQVALTNIPLGGPGTIYRHVYRRKDGGVFKRVTTIVNNTATTFNDNVADGGLLEEPLTVSTAERSFVAVTADEVGADANVVAGAVNELVDIPSGISGVTNLGSFTGGSDSEDTETFRSRLLDFVRAPKSGSKADLETWAEAIEGVDQATAFPNDNLGVVTAGHVTVRVAGANGSVPPAEVVSAVLADLVARNVANIIIHVTTFTPVSTNVTVDVTTEAGFLLADVTPSAQQAIIDYINAVSVGGTVYAAGVIDAVFGIPGIANVTTAFADATSTATQKRIPGVITIT